jgi:hypothetical protein
MSVSIPFPLGPGDSDIASADKTVTLFVARAFGFALDVKVMLGWVSWKENTFTSDEARERCKRLLGEGAKCADVGKYLQEQGKALEQWRNQLRILKH